jgi:hypothetical protein
MESGTRHAWPLVLISVPRYNHGQMNHYNYMTCIPPAHNDIKYVKFLTSTTVSHTGFEPRPLCNSVLKSEVVHSSEMLNSFRTTRHSYNPPVFHIMSQWLVRTGGFDMLVVPITASEQAEQIEWPMLAPCVNTQEHCTSADSSFSCWRPSTECEYVLTGLLPGALNQNQFPHCANRKVLSQRWGVGAPNNDLECRNVPSPHGWRTQHHGEMVGCWLTGATK